MIILLTATGKGHSWRNIAKWDDMPVLKRWSSWQVFHRRKVPHATYIFTDFDRLAPWELELASRLYRLLKASGAKVLNDPAKFKNRYALLKMLKNHGINDFDVWSAGLEEVPDRFPVFLRTQAAHRGPIGDLLYSRAQARQALEQALSQGYVKADLVFIEFCGQKQAKGFYQKLASHRIGDSTVASLGGYDTDWQVKGLANTGCDDLWEQSLGRIRNNTHSETVRKACNLADLEFGRADFAVVDERVQIYEINTNPIVGDMIPIEMPAYIAAFTLFKTKYKQAMKIIDTKNARPAILLDDVVFRSQRRKDWPTLGYHRAIR